MAAIEYRGLNAVTNFDLSRYIKWLRPSSQNDVNGDNNITQTPNQGSELKFPLTQQNHVVDETVLVQPPPVSGAGPTSALGLLLQSSKFKEMMEMTLAAEQSESDPPPSRFPDEIQTYFECRDSGNYGEDVFFGDLNSFLSEFDAEVERN